MRSKISIMGLYYANYHLFDGLPNIKEALEDYAEETGYNVIEGAVLSNDDLINEIITECADLEIMYPDPHVMERLIRQWATSALPSWKRLYLTTIMEFNPVENYDRYEEYHDESEGAVEVKNSETENFVSGFNSSNYEPSGKSTAKGKTVNDASADRTGHLHGNIGVTTNTQMLKEAQNFYTGFNINKHIVESFKDRFCLLIY